MAVRTNRFLASSTLVGLGLALAFGGCIASGDTDGSGGAATTTSSTSSGLGGSADGGGGSGGVGMGGDGSGGDSLCEVDCSTIQTTNPCLQAVCNDGMYPGTIGTCIVVDADPGTSCDDGLFCTTNDTCTTNGQCAGGPPNDCGITAEQCSEVVCDEDDDKCVPQAAGDGTVCVTDDPCEVNTVCSNGLCVGEPKSCLFAPVPDDCHVAVCDPNMNGACVPVEGNDGEACNDANDQCTVNKVCASGVCQGGAPMDCSALSFGCQTGVCDVNNGTCVADPIMDGNSCSDGDFCTLNDVCTAGMCGGATVVTACQDGDMCCPDGCDETTDNDCILNILLLTQDVPDSTTSPGLADYRAALTAAGVNWTEWDINTAGVSFPTAAELQPYNTVIWGETGTIAADSAEAQIMADWLNGPGLQRLMLASRDFMWDFQGTGTTGENNLYSLWGMTYVGDGVSQATGLASVDGDPLTGSFFPTPLEIGSTLSPDYANASLGPATHAGLYVAGGTGDGQSGLAHYSVAEYRIVWLGVNFHDGLAQEAQKNELMTNIINYFK